MIGICLWLSLHKSNSRPPDSDVSLRKLRLQNNQKIVYVPRKLFYRPLTL